MKRTMPRHNGLQVEWDPSDERCVEMAPKVFDLLSPAQQALFVHLFMPHLTVAQRAIVAHYLIEVAL